MTIKDYLVLAQLVIYVVAIAVVYGFGNLHFKNQKAAQKLNAAKKLAASYVAYYETQEIGDPEKLKGAISDTVKALKNKGFNINETDVLNVQAMVEEAVKDLHLRQKVANAVPEVNVDAGDKQPDAVVDKTPNPEPAKPATQPAVTDTTKANA